MAMLKFDPTAHPLPDWGNLSLRDPEEPRINELETLIGPVEAAELQKLRARADVLSQKKRDEVLHFGKATPATIQDANDADDAYDLMEEDCFARFPQLAATISRKTFNVSPPPPPKGKLALGNPLPIHGAAMDMLWPGFYPDHYEFLKKHKGNYHFPETMGSLGAVFVSPPNVSVERNRKLFNHLQHVAKPEWRTAPVVTLDTTRRSLLKLLAQYESDYVAVVVDEGNQIIGTVGHKEAEGKKDEQTVNKFYTRIDRVPTADISLTAKQAFADMQKDGTEYRITIDDVPRIMTKTTAALSNLLPAFTYGKGLGAMLTVGVSKNSNPVQYLRDIVKDTDYDLESGYTPFAGVLIDTALCARRDVYNMVSQIRDILPNTYLMAGTVTTPKATKKLLRKVDCVKVGIAEGGHCKTAKTGVRIPNAWAAIECGAEAEGKGQIAADGLHDETEFTLGMAVKNVSAKIGGGSLNARIESAMPIEIDEQGRPSKKGRGMAASTTEEDRRRQRELSEYEQYEEQVGIHGEGENGRLNPIRDPDTLGRFFWKLTSHLRSGGRYADADDINQFQERSSFHYINQKNGQ